MLFAVKNKKMIAKGGDIKKILNFLPCKKRKARP